MKRLLLIILLLLIVCSCNSKKEPTEENLNNASSYSSEKEEPKEEPKKEDPIVIESGYSNLKLIDFQQLKKKILYGDSFILVVTQTSCSHCHAYKPVLNEVLSNNDILAYELDVQQLNENEFDEVLEYLDVESTPQTLFFINGEEKIDYRLRGEATKKDIEKVIKKLNY